MYLAKVWWMQLIGAGIVIVWLVILSMFSENLKKWVQKMRIDRAKMKEAMEKLQAESDRDTIHKFAKTISEA